MPSSILDEQVEKKRQQEILGTLIAGYIKTRGKTSEEIGNIMGCSRPTVSKKMKNPGTITINELQELQKGLNVPSDLLQSTVKQLF